MIYCQVYVPIVYWAGVMKKVEDSRDGFNENLQIFALWQPSLGYT